MATSYGGRQQGPLNIIKSEYLARNNLSDRAYQMTVRREWASWVSCLQLLDRLIDLGRLR